MNSSEEKIKQAFKDHNWNEIKTQDSWVIFKVWPKWLRVLKN